MKKILFFAVFFSFYLVADSAFSQAADNNFRFSGFVKYDFFYDARDMVAARQGQFSLFPAPKNFNANGNDMNGDPSFHMLSIQSRLAMEVTGPKAFGASSRAFVEGAFFGNIETDINGFRLRHAFVELNWDGRHRLMMGQFWHPLFAERAVPGVVGFNTGAPFKPFARNPQLRYTFTEGGTSIILAALSQIDFAGQGGPETLRRSAIPNLHLQVQQQFGSVLTGIGSDFKQIRPRINTGEERLNSFALTAFGNYASEDFRFMIQSTYGQNLFDHLMLGGFAVQETTDGYKLRNMEVGSVWLDSSYGKTTRFGLFAGYTENFGAENDITPGITAYRGADINNIWRVAPRVEWTSGQVKLSTEVEISSAAYGVPDASGVVRNTESVTNYRMMFAAWYFF